MTGGAPAAAGARVRPLWPREHGAYGQIALPLVAALAMGQPVLASGLLVLAALATFVAHEPLLVRLGARGARARQDHGRRAARVGLGCAAVAIAAGLAGLRVGGLAVAAASAFPLGVALALLPLVLSGREKTTSGEVLAAAALSGASVPVAVAGRVPLPDAVAAWAAWIFAFTIATAAVRAAIARHKTGRGEGQPFALAAAATAGAGLLALVSPYALAAAPTALAGWALLARPPHPRNLKRVGWTLVACSAATAAIVAAVARWGSAST